MNKSIKALVIGDVIVVAVVTIYGFFTHDKLEESGWYMLTTFIPVLVAWLLIGPLLGAYNNEYSLEIRHLWRPVWAMIIAAPMAALIRGFWLNRAIAPIFVVVLGGVSAIGLLAWRVIFLVISSKRAANG